MILTSDFGGYCALVASDHVSVIRADCGLQSLRCRSWNC